MVHGIDALVAAKKPPFEAIDALVAAKTPPFRSYRRAGGCENAPPSTSCEASGMPNARPIIGISARLRPRLLSSSCVLGFVGLLSDLKGKARPERILLPYGAVLRFQAHRGWPRRGGLHSSECSRAHRSCRRVRPPPLQSMGFIFCRTELQSGHIEIDIGMCKTPLRRLDFGRYVCMYVISSTNCKMQ